MIRKLHLFNFKGFKDSTFDFKGKDLIILGGKNGFGKTTVFDAIELILTGKISRYEKYIAEINDNRLALNNDLKPLVCNMKVDSVSVEGLFDFSNGEGVWLKRYAHTRDMGNPINFGVFSTLYIKRNGEDCYSKCTDIDKLIPSTVSSKFGFLHYLDQEEATSFLFKKEKDRNEMLSRLFNTKSFDNDMEKCRICLSKLKESKVNVDNEISNIKKNIEAISAIKLSGKSEEYNVYEKMANSVPTWDKPADQLNMDDYNSILCENGILDNLEYLCLHFSQLISYLRNKWLENLLQSQMLNKLGVYSFLNPVSKWINVAKNLNFFMERMKKTNASNLSDLNFDWVMEADDVVNQNIINDITESIGKLTLKYNTLTAKHRQYMQLLEERDSISRVLQSDTYMYKDKCPLCGYDYGSSDSLAAAIKGYSEFLRQFATGLMNEVENDVNTLKIHIVKAVIEPINASIESLGITYEMCLRYDESQAENIRLLDKKFGIILERQTNLESQIEYVRLQLLAKKEKETYESTLDYNQLTRTYESYWRNIEKEMFTLDNIQRKRNYLVTSWNKIKSSKIESLNREKGEKEKLKDKITKRHNDLTTLRKNIESNRNAYLDRLISDIGILFYIYSGRIMQDCRYGRGVFLNNKNKGRVMFVSGNCNHDVDVLYNMSSGQLSSVIIALTLALNKLYAEQKFIAIDDPLQTIDDMNFWGFMETLRHEFKDYNIMLSTHEDEYGKLLNYKCSKLGISSDFIDISESGTQKG